MNNSFADFAAVVDSGVGGLTVLQTLRSRYPHCNFVYIADSANCPYGTKSNEEIFARVSTLVGWLEERKVSSVVLACNTASVFADKLRVNCGIPIFDVILPTCRLVSETTRSKRVTLLATNATVRSGVYRKTLAKMGITTVQFACSGLVQFVENNTVCTPDCDFAVRSALADLSKANADTVILGCTHFPLLRKKIQPFVGKARVVQCVSDFHPSSAPQEDAQKISGGKHGKTLFFTTGSVAAAKNASRWFGEAHFVHINI